MTTDEAILILSHHPKLGSQSIKKILAAGYPKKTGGLALADKLRHYLSEAILNGNLQAITENLAKHNIGYVTYRSKEYPKMLSEIPDYPVILFVKGCVESLSAPGVSVVGSRKYTPYGARIAKQFSYQLAANGLAVISGLALGIDTIAHRAALDAAGLTIGVLGCGLDSIYPVSNQGLANEIINNGGALISEYPPGTEPLKSNFPARNRIIAGLSSGTLVVEAAESSGALITAAAALEYNREVYSIPGPVDAESSKGTNYLIQQGAKLVVTPLEISEDYDVAKIRAEAKAQQYLPVSQKEVDILETVGSGSLYADEIVRSIDYNVAEVSYILTMLEMKGILENVNGMWRRKI